MTIRPCEESDLPGILAILNREILTGYAHFGTEPQTLQEITQEWTGAGGYPWLIADIEGSVAGFTRASPWKRRGAYKSTIEIGVYVDELLRGKGIAKALYQEMLPAVRAGGFHTALGGIALPNPASVKLHESFGFRHVGTLPEVGFKHGRWIDVGYWALTLSS